MQQAWSALCVSPEETDALSARVLDCLPANAVLLLEGGMGAGKTTFTRMLGRRLGILEPVTSPTFAICNFYKGHRQLVHIDAWRLGSPAAFDALLVEDFLEPPWLIVVEWPERVPRSWLQNAFRLCIHMQADRPGLRWFHFSPVSA